MKKLPDWPFNFACINEHYDYKNSKVVILPFPYEVSTSFKGGCREGPLSIISASRFVELYDEELDAEVYKVGIHTFPEIEYPLNNLYSPMREIKKRVKNILLDGKFPVVIGGEHSLTLGAVEGVREKYEDISVIQLDAHCDLRNTYQSNKFSHASVMRRIREICPSVFQVGIRSFSREESNYLKENKIEIFSSREINIAYSKISPKLNKNVFITVDVDVFDPSIVPAVGTPEPGGVSWYEVLSFLKPVFCNFNVVGFDVVELAPIPGNVVSDFLCAKLIYKLIGYKFFLR